MKKNTKKVTSTKSPLEGTQLNKYIAIAGVCSRRNAVELIKEGHVKVNGKVIKEPGHRVMSGDAVKVKNRLLSGQQEPVYVLLNKPQGVVTTVSDEQGRATVIDLIKLPKGQRVYPVGRLDVNTTGVLILTNDGNLAQKLAHPSHQLAKVYDVTVHRAIESNDVELIKKGVRLKDGIMAVDDVFMIETPKQNKIRITIHSGKNRVVRRLFEAMGYIVEKLDRLSFGGISKRGLSVGQWRTLKKIEIERLLK